MLDQLIVPLLVAASLSAALVSGVFLTFSDFVMRSLAGSAPAAGAEAMQQINREVFRSVFMVLLLGSAPVAAGLLIYAWVSASAPAAGWIAAGALSYLVGVMAVTIFGNVPMNERLDRMDHLSAEGQGYWRRYARDWTRWNHLRAAAAFMSAAGYLMGALQLA